MSGKRYSNRVKLVLQVNDLVVMNISFITATLLIHHSLWYWSDSRQFLFPLLLNLVWIVLSGSGDLYAIRRQIRMEQELNKTFFVVLLHFIVISLFLYWSRIFVEDSLDKTIFYALFVTMLPVWKVVSLRILKFLRRKGFNFRKIVIIGGGEVGNQVHNVLLSDHSFGFKYLGLFDDNPERCQYRHEIIGTVDDFRSMALVQQVDEVFIALPNHARRKISEIIRFCDAHAIRIKIVPDFMRYIKPKVELDFYGSIPIILLHNEPLESLKNRFIKRSFDVIFSLLVIVLLLSWLYPLLALLIKMDSRGPVMFKQKRTGLDSKDFYIWKFRSMKLNNDSDRVQATRGDPRITPLGAFLRKSNLDEMPQFFNVLMGQMSVIGPRPHMLQHTAQYSALIKGYLVRHYVKPGLTGWAQVNGFRGETKETWQMEARVRHDVYYLENWSPYLDMKIFFKTIINMIRGEENAG